VRSDTCSCSLDLAKALSDATGQAPLRLLPRPCGRFFILLIIIIALSYIGKHFAENSVGGKWLMGKWLRTPLSLLGRGNGLVGG
jgi:hypothetical protein